MNGGRNLVATGVTGGYKRLHAFNVCAAQADRVRWIVDVPGASGQTYSLGHSTVTHGIVYIGTDQGHLVAIADPSKFPPTGWRCVNPDVATANCVGAGYTLVPDPAVLANVTLSGSMVYNEPVLADGKAFVATGIGKVYMLSP
jgi:outer membrane protein assembly factor BamB